MDRKWKWSLLALTCFRLRLTTLNNNLAQHMNQAQRELQVTPNLGFFEQLSIWEKDLAGAAVETT